MGEGYSHVIWDWNGTLFNDVSWCISTVNTMLNKRSLTPLKGLKEYHAAFCFPIIDYYKNVGFDFKSEPFESLAIEFISLYHSADEENCLLHENALTVLDIISKSKIHQIILSASEKSNLSAQMNRFCIDDYFDEILGISNIYAKSKVDIGLDYLSRTKIKNAVLIGDTVHDYEVAKALGIDCILIANGHQDKKKLLECNTHVVDNIIDVLPLVIGWIK